MQDHIFRMYDIRGKVYEELDIDEIYNFANALAYFLKKKNPVLKTIVVGMDGRSHSPLIKEKLCQGLLDSGIDVVFIGLCPTPVMYFALHTMSVDAGVMITASHNPKNYNGIKICLGKDPVWGDLIQELKNDFKAKKILKQNKVGSLKIINLVEQYINWVYDKFKHLAGADINIVFDCGNGATGVIWPSLVEKMEWKNAKILYGEVDGDYPNHEADPTIEDNVKDLKIAVKKYNSLAGLGFDGDGDRVAAVTNKGKLLLGDKLMAIFSQEMIKTNSQMAVVYDIKCSSGLSELLCKWGAKPFMSPTGNPIVRHNLKKNNALISGELSCHFTFADRYFGFDDGTYAAMRLIEILIQSNKDLDELISIFPEKINSPEIRIECEEKEKFDIINKVQKAFATRKDVDIINIDGVRVEMNNGWGILRASNTQPIISLRCEANSPEDLIKIKKEFYLLMKDCFDEEFLKKKIDL